jgi:uncharacterized damage-inducible protein DinB
VAEAESAAPAIRAFLPTGGYANAVGLHLAALDHGLEEVKVRARRVPAGKLGTRVAPDVRTPAELVLHVAEIERKWVHEGIGGQASATPAPPATAPLEALFAHLDATRETTAAILKPLVERDLDTLRSIPGHDGRTTVRRALVELLEHQAHHRGQLGMLARLLADRRGA